MQLKQQGIIDTQTLQENMDGLDNISKIQQRISAEKAETVLFESLMAQAAQGNPKATMAAAEIRKNPAQMTKILDKFYTAEEETSPEEQAVIGGPQGPVGPQGPQDIASVLAGLAGAQPPQPGGPVG